MLAMPGQRAVSLGMPGGMQARTVSASRRKRATVVAMESNDDAASGFRRQVTFRIGPADAPLLELVARAHGGIQAGIVAALRAHAAERLQPPPAEEPTVKPNVPVRETEASRDGEAADSEERVELNVSEGRADQEVRRAQSSDRSRPSTNRGSDRTEKRGRRLGPLQRSRDPRSLQFVRVRGARRRRGGRSRRATNSG